MADARRAFGVGKTPSETGNGGEDSRGARGSRLGVFGNKIGSLVGKLRPRSGRRPKANNFDDNSMPEAGVKARPSQEQIQALRQLTQWLIPMAHITWHEKLAAGAFGEVWRCTWLGHPAAIKKLFKALDLEEDPATALDFQRECETLQAIKHPHLLNFFGAGVTPLKDEATGKILRMPFLATEFMLLGSLRSVLNEFPRRIDFSTSLRIATEIAKGMKHLHALGIVHRDLKSDNCLCSLSLHTKVCDFGSSKVLQKREGNIDPRQKIANRAESLVQSTQGWTGTTLWAAPETYGMDDTSKLSGKVDLYSYAIVMYELLTRRMPWDELETETYIEVWGFLCEQLPAGKRPKIDQYLKDEHPKYIKTMEMAWVTDPEERPTFDEVVDYLKVSATETMDDEVNNSTDIIPDNKGEPASQVVGDVVGDSDASQQDNAHLSPADDCAKATTSDMTKPPDHDEPVSEDAIPADDDAKPAGEV